MRENDPEHAQCMNFSEDSHHLKFSKLLILFSECMDFPLQLKYALPSSIYGYEQLSLLNSTNLLNSILTAVKSK